MPKYEFLCTSCKTSFERLLTVAERDVAKSRCPKCASRAVTPQMAIFAARTSRKG
jgi:putative FmdB family regulatory protein